MVELNPSTINPLGEPVIIEHSATEWERFDEIARKLLTVEKQKVGAQSGEKPKKS